MFESPHASIACFCLSYLYAQVILAELNLLSMKIIIIITYTRKKKERKKKKKKKKKKKLKKKKKQTTKKNQKQTKNSVITYTPINKHAYNIHTHSFCTFYRACWRPASKKKNKTKQTKQTNNKQNKTKTNQQKPSHCMRAQTCHRGCWRRGRPRSCAR